tara:strand:+ start:985 stop:2649 length:1665 start_codon:yes stop_codon:yes gene_type:complete
MKNNYKNLSNSELEAFIKDKNVDALYSSSILDIIVEELIFPFINENNNHNFDSLENCVNHFNQIQTKYFDESSQIYKQYPDNEEKREELEMQLRKKIGYREYSDDKVILLSSTLSNLTAENQKKIDELRAEILKSDSKEDKKGYFSQISKIYSSSEQYKSYKLEINNFSFVVLRKMKKSGLFSSSSYLKEYEGRSTYGSVSFELNNIFLKENQNYGSTKNLNQKFESEKEQVTPKGDESEGLNKFLYVAQIKFIYDKSSKSFTLEKVTEPFSKADDIKFDPIIDEFAKLFSHEIDDKVDKKIRKKLISELEDELKSRKDEKLAVTSFADEFKKQYDADGNALLDIIDENGFSEFLTSSQEKIIEIDKKYIHNFIKLSSFLNAKADNLQNTFNLILDAEDVAGLDALKETFDCQYHAYLQIIFQSYSMLLAAKKQNLVKFYEHYEEFDKLNVFDSNWERDLSNQLKEIKQINLESRDAMFKIAKQIVEMETSIIDGLNTGFNKLDSSIKDMNESLTKELKGVNNKLWWNNVLQGVQIYQNRQHTKALNKISKSLS